MPDSRPTEPSTEVADGLHGAESLVINPPDDLVSGELVAFAAKAETEVATE